MTQRGKQPKWIDRLLSDGYGRQWPKLSVGERCETCGQPDNCGDCNHQMLSVDNVLELGGELRRSKAKEFACKTCGAGAGMLCYKIGGDVWEVEDKVHEGRVRYV